MTMTMKNYPFWLLRIMSYERYNELSQKTKPTRRQKILKQKLELMTYRDDFLAEIRFIRKRFGISPNGFPNFKGCISWAKDMEKDSDIKKYAAKDPLRAYAKLKSGAVALLQSTPVTEYEKRLKDFIHSFKIDDRWLGAVEYYLLFGSIDAHEVLPKSVEIKMMADGATGRQSLYLRISSDAEQEDVLDEWATIETFQGIARSQRHIDYRKKPSEELIGQIEKINPIPYVDKQRKEKERAHSADILKKYQRAYTMRCSGKSYREIAKELHCGQAEAGVYIKRFKDAIKSVELD